MCLSVSNGIVCKGIEGSIWGGFWAHNAYSMGKSVYDLCQTYAVAHSDTERSVKINTAIKNALVNSCSLGGSTGHIVHWAHEARVISLGKYAYLAKTISYGGGLIVNMLEGAYGVYRIYTDAQKILNAQTPSEKGRYKQQICHRLLKLMGNIAMVAWAALGIVALTANLLASSTLMTILLVASSFFPISAYFYREHLEREYPNLFPNG